MGGAGALVSANGADRSPAVAVTVYEPGMLFAVNGGALAMPSAPVITAAGPENVPEAPAAGAVKVTVTPATGRCCASSTLARSGANSVWQTAFCPFPEST